jgi:hypothetical protein
MFSEEAILLLSLVFMHLTLDLSKKDGRERDEIWDNSITQGKMGIL